MLARLKAWAGRNAANLAAVGALCAVALGFWLWFPPLGLIVPGAFVLACLIARHIFRGV